jgi:hypothetical protein
MHLQLPPRLFLELGYRGGYVIGEHLDGPHSGAFSVDDATYLVSVLRRFATRSSGSVTLGQDAAKSRTYAARAGTH